MAIVDGAAGQRSPCSMAERTVNLGVIGGGLMGRELASAVARWIHLENLGVTPRLVHVCDIEPQTLAWYERLADSRGSAATPRRCSRRPKVEAVYVAVPHNLHAELYVEALEAGKHLLGEKPFGIDREANEGIMRAVAAHPGLVVRCSSEMPFFPGGQEVWRWIAAERFGRRSRSARCSFTRATSTPSRSTGSAVPRPTAPTAVLSDLGMHALRAAARRLGPAGRAGAARRHRRAARRAAAAPVDTPDNAVLLCRGSTPAARCASRPSGSRRARRTRG